MAAAACSPPNTLVPHQSRPEVLVFPISAFYTTGLYYIVLVPSGLIFAFSKKQLSGCKVCFVFGSNNVYIMLNKVLCV